MFITAVRRRRGGSWDLQSSYALDRMRYILVYVRRKIANVEHVRPKTSTRIVYLLTVDGSLRFGVTPWGGAPAGPLSRAWVCCSAAGVVVVDAMAVNEAKLEEK